MTSMNRMNYSILLALLALGSVEAHAGSKGYCKSDQGGAPLTRVPGQHSWDTSWKAELGQGVVGTVTFEPGYGMTFVSLTVRENDRLLSQSRVMISGVFNADSTAEETNPDTMERFNALSSIVQTSQGTVECTYHFFMRINGS